MLVFHARKDVSAIEMGIYKLANFGEWGAAI
jgi:hypothetical protein